MSSTKYPYGYNTSPSPLIGKNVLITGASAGIGEACAMRFAQLGCVLHLSARRLDRLEDLRSSILESYPNLNVHVHKMDVSDVNQVNQVIQNIQGNIDILVNNAGLALGTDPLWQISNEGIDQVIDTNVKGLLYVTRISLQKMRSHGSGHVINIGSIVGTYPCANASAYCASKHAVRGITETLRIELVDTPIIVSEIQPGLVETEFSIIRFNNDTEKAKKIYQNIEPLYADDIADTIIYVATRPPNVQIATLTVYPRHQATPQSIYRGSQ